MLFAAIGVWSTALLLALAATWVLARGSVRRRVAAARTIEAALPVMLGAGVWLWGTGVGIGRSWLVGAALAALAAVAVLEGVALPAARRPADAPPRSVRPVPPHRAALAVAVLVVTSAALGLQLPEQGAVVVTLGIVTPVALALLSLPLVPMPGPPGVRAVTVLAAVTVVVGGTGAWRSDASRLPESFSMHSPGGGAGAAAVHGGHGGGVLAKAGGGGALAAARVGGAPTVSVADLTGPAPGAEAVRAYTLTVDELSVSLTGGGAVAGLGVNGSSPGPVIRAAVGDRVTVELRNESAESTSLHWHGVDLPNSQDGVAGVTQDAAAPGATHRYSWIADRAGTYWYHAHQDSFEQVRRGVFGAIVIDPVPSAAVAADEDRTLLAHSWLEDQPELVAAEPADAAAVPAGATVRARFVNTDNEPHSVTLSTPFRVAALDGRDIPGGAELSAGTMVDVPAGGRADLSFVQPDRGATEFRLAGTGQNYLFGSGEVPDEGGGGTFDLTSYGTPDSATLTSLQQVDREHHVTVTARLGFFDGGFGMVNTLNRGLRGDADMLMVAEGDLVRVTLTNRSYQVHPMHLHGHHVTVVAHNGKPVTGHPMALDSLDVEPRESWTVVFRADNPGLWMYHCHNLRHAAAGMDLMLGYEGVTTPYLVGGPAGNKPE